MSTTKTATFVKNLNGNGTGRVYHVDPPAPVHDWSAAHMAYECTGEGDCSTTDHVWVSAVDVPFSGPETYIFACDSAGKVTNWGGMDGSYKGGLDHERALRGAGYEV